MHVTSLKTYPVLCGSVAGKASKLGVALHDAAYRELNLDFKYVAIETDDLRQALNGFRSLNFRGFGISMPYKMAIIEYLDELSQDVRSIGACNTVVNNSGKWKGHNTDWQGAIAAINEIGAKKPEKALIVGSGGVARAIAYGLRKSGWKVWVAGRNSATVGALVRELGLEGALSISEQAEVGAQLIVNATPIAESHGAPIMIKKLRDARYLLDVVFIPKETKLAAFARQQGLAVAPGWRMLLHQALYQFELYTGKNAPHQTMASVLEKALS